MVIGIANTRTVLIWWQNGAERLTFAVNPRHITVSRPQTVKEFVTINGESVSLSGGRGLLGVTLETFLPSERSPFFTGVGPQTAIDMLKKWQDSRKPVRLIISGTDINDAFLISGLDRRVSEGDDDVYIRLALREYKFLPDIIKAAPDLTAGQLAPRADERAVSGTTYTVRQGDTLWAIAVRFYGDGLRWKDIAQRNGVVDERKLQIGKVLVLP